MSEAFKPLNGGNRDTQGPTMNEQSQNEQTNAVPTPDNLPDFFDWVALGHRRTSYLLDVYGGLYALAERLVKREPADARCVAGMNAQFFVDLAEEVRGMGYQEAADVSECAAAWLRAFSEKGASE